MNKLKVLGIIAATLTLSCGVAACNKHEHSFSEEWKTSETQHWHVATCEHTEEKGDLGDHVDENSDKKCDVCGYVLASATPDGTVGLTATKTKTSYDLTAGGLDLDVSDLKVYYAKQDGTQNGEVPSTDYKVEYYSGTTKLDSKKVTAAGVYTLVVKVEKVKVGDTVKDLTAEVDVTVLDDIKVETLKLKDGATLTQEQAPEDKMTSTWKFEVERKSGAKSELTAKDVKISNLDTVTEGTQKVAKVTYTETNPANTEFKAEIEVKYDITKGELVTKSYAVNFNGYADGHKFKATGDKLMQGDKEICEVVSNAREVDKPENTKALVEDKADQEFGTKYFTQRFKFGGSSSAADGRWLKFELKNTTQITVIFSGNAGRGIRLFKDAYDASADAPTAGNLIDSAKTEEKDTLYEKKFVVFPGTYLLANWDSANAENKGGDCYLWYIQLDEFVAKTETAVTLPTEGKEYALLDVTLDEATVKKTYNIGDEADKTGISAKAIFIHPVTAEKTETALSAAEIKLTIDTATAGVGKTATVSCQVGEVTKTFEYTVDVVDASVKNVKDITAALKSGVVTQADEGQKFTLKKSDIVVTTVKVDAEAAETAEMASYVVKYNGTEIDDTTGAEFAISADGYELTVIATYPTASGGTKEFTTTVTITVTKTPSADLPAPVAISFDAYNDPNKVPDTNATKADIQFNADVTLTVDSEMVTAAKLMPKASDVGNLKTKSGTELKDANGATVATVNSCYCTNGGAKNNAAGLAITLAAGTYNITVYGSSTAADRVLAILPNGVSKADTASGALLADAFSAVSAIEGKTFNNVSGGGTIVIGGNNNVDIYYVVITQVA